MGQSTTTLAAMHPIELVLRAHALTFPGVTEDFPWDHCALKVKGKVFVFLGNGRDRISMTTKLPMSHGGALMLPFAEPTGYGLGKSGWVTARFDNAEEVPVGILKDWIDESYRAVAPKKMLEALGGEATTSSTAKKKVTVSSTAKKATPASSATKKSQTKKEVTSASSVKKKKTSTMKKVTSTSPVKKATEKKKTSSTVK
jgi:predicted DNA-binding protein (MmcQ/YjbR family)